MSWTVLLVVALGAYGFKALGQFVLSRVELSGPLADVVAYLPAALFGGLVVQQVLAELSDGIGELDSDLVWTRAAGVAAGAVAVRLKAPLLVVIVVSAGVAALLRLAV